MKSIKLAATAMTDLAGAAFADDSASVSVLRVGSQSTAKASSEYYSGEARVDSLFKGTGDARISGGIVTFEPAARTAWHTHPLGQTLFITAGVGRVQQWGKPVQEMKPGDIVWIPPGVKHWHGASPTEGMTHLAVAEQLDGSAVQWLEKVSDEQYLAK